MPPRLGRDDYTVGWVCALPIELAAAQEMLEEVHDDLPHNNDNANIYILGRIGEHNVVLACLPAGQTGTNSAATVAMQMMATFRAIRFGLMVGIGGGVPSAEEDIRLGDIVVSQPGKSHGGVIQYDFGKATPSGFERTGFLNSPPQILLISVAKLRANHDRGKSDLSVHITKLSRLLKFRRDQAGNDVLFERGYNHAQGNDCLQCDGTRQLQREARMEETPKVHYGTIASGNQMIRDGTTRDQISSEFGGVLCFEMEAAGLMNSFPCLVIRGICDYADSHKNKKWQAYAAGTAAAYAKELLLVVPKAYVAKTQTVDEATKEQFQAPSPVLPLIRNRRFIGRNAELDALKQKLLVNKDCQKVALVGLGGIGKTQIALQFAYAMRRDHPEFFIFWVPALSMETFKLACVEIGGILGIRQSQESKEDIRKLVQQRLSARTAGRWLLIVDNCDDLDLLRGVGQQEGILDFLPESDDGLTLFTTRHHEVAQAVAGGDMVEVNKMEAQEAIDLVSRSLAQKSQPNDDALITDLLTELDYLPLAIIQATAYINIKKSSISEYLSLLKASEQDTIAILNTEFHDNTRYKKSANAIAKTWTVTFNQILQHDSVAADLLAFISCIEWKAIPVSMLPAVQPKARMASAIGTLCSYSFLEKRDGGKTLDMHRLVHLATRTWIIQNGREVKMRKKALKHLITVFPSDDYMNRQIWREYLPHVACIDKDGQGEQGDETSELCLKVGRCLYVDGRMKEALLWLQKSYEKRKESLAEDHPDRLSSQLELAGAYEANGQVKEAVKLLERVVAVRVEVLAEDHPDRLASQHELARTYRANGQVKEAVKLLERVVSIEAEVHAEDHPDRLSSQHALAVVYQANGQVKEAVKLLERVVAVRVEVLAEDHPSRLASQHELAAAYHANGQVKVAVKLLERVVAIRVEVLAEDHPDRLASQHELARAYQANGQVKEAVKLLERVVGIKAEVFAEDHPSRLVSEELLTFFYENMSERSETGQTPRPSIEDIVAEDEGMRQVKQAVEVSRATSSNRRAFFTRLVQLPADRELKSSNTSKKRHFWRRLGGIARKEN